MTIINGANVQIVSIFMVGVKRKLKKEVLNIMLKILILKVGIFIHFNFHLFLHLIMNNNTFCCYPNIDDNVGIIDDTMDYQELHRSNRQFRKDLKCKIPEHFQYENVEQLVHFYFRNFPDKYVYFLECLNKIK